MKILVTGQSGVGKSSILKKINLKNKLDLDSFIKLNLYKNDSEVISLLKKNFGEEIIYKNKINAQKLGQIVFTDLTKLKKLDKLLFPYIKKILLSLKGLWIVEMAIYMNYEKKFRKFFDKVILIERKNKNLSKKFKYLKEKIQPIKDNKIKYDFIIHNDKEIKDSVSEMKKILNSILKK